MSDDNNGKRKSTLIRFTDVLVLQSIHQGDGQLSQDKICQLVNDNIDQRKYKHAHAINTRASMANSISRLRVSRLLSKSGPAKITARGNRLLSQLPNNLEELNAMIELREKGN